MAFTQSYTVQKYRSRIHRASWSPLWSSTGRESRAAWMSFRFRPAEGSSARDRTMPSEARLPAAKGTSTRVPGASTPSNSAGTR